MGENENDAKQENSSDNSSPVDNNATDEIANALSELKKDISDISRLDWRNSETGEKQG
jgi:hypothetical protein